MDSSLCTIVAGAAYSSALYAKLLVGWELTQAGQDDMLEMVANLQQVCAPSFHCRFHRPSVRQVGFVCEWLMSMC